MGYLMTWSEVEYMIDTNRNSGSYWTNFSFPIHFCGSLVNIKKLWMDLYPMGMWHLWYNSERGIEPYVQKPHMCFMHLFGLMSIFHTCDVLHDKDEISRCVCIIFLRFFFESYYFLMIYQFPYSVPRPHVLFLIDFKSAKIWSVTEVSSERKIYFHMSRPRHVN